MMDASFKTRFARLHLRLQPGDVLTCTEEICIFYEAVPMFGEVIVKYVNHGYGLLCGEDVVRVMRAVVPGEEPDGETVRRWRQVAMAPKTRRSKDIMTMLLTQHMWDEFGAMVEHKL